MTTYNSWKNNVECEISNSANPYDEAGEQHNELMATIEKEGSKDMPLEEVFALTDEV